MRERERKRGVFQSVEDKDKDISFDILFQCGIGEFFQFFPIFRLQRSTEISGIDFLKFSRG